MDRYRQALEQCQSEGTYRTLPDIEVRGKYIDVEGRQLLNLNSNDYLGLLAEPQLWQRFIEEEGKRRYPSSGSSRLLTGNSPVAQQFEGELANAYGLESALLWDSGYHANTGIPPVLALPNTLFIADKLVHASIIDGLRLSGAPFQRYRHNDLSHLRKILSRYADQFDTLWLITESLFSMDGDIAPLQELVALKEEYPHLYIYVDEAHAVGLFGPKGLGLAAEMGVTREIDLLIGTLGKALGSVGAYSLQSDTLRQLLVSKARSLIFSTALPEVNVAWSRFLFHAIQEMDDRRQHLKDLVTLFGKAMGREFTSQIIPLIVPGEEQVTKAAEQLCRHGFYIRPIRRPTVPQGSERLRLSLTAAMTTDEIIQLANLCNSI